MMRFSQNPKSNSAASLCFHNHQVPDTTSWWLHCNDMATLLTTTMDLEFSLNMFEELVVFAHWWAKFFGSDYERAFLCSTFNLSSINQRYMRISTNPKRYEFSHIKVAINMLFIGPFSSLLMIKICCFCCSFNEF